MGEPSGGASLGSNVECKILIENDILPGKLEFGVAQVVMKQSDEEITIPILRSGFVDGLHDSYT